MTKLDFLLGIREYIICDMLKTKKCSKSDEMLPAVNDICISFECV